MKDTPVTNGYIKAINDSIYDLSYYNDFDDEPFVCMYPNDFIDELQVSLNNLKKIDIDLVKAEFVDTLEDYSKVFFQKKVFEFKFERLLNWEYDYENGVEENLRKFNSDFSKFTEYQIAFQVDVHSIEYNRLKEIFINLSGRVTYLKYQVKSMLAHYDELGNIYLQANSMKIFPAEKEILSKKNQPESFIKVKSASKRKTDIIKLLSAMYDANMFADAEGKPLTNKQKLMETFGEFLGDDFSAYSTSLSQAKTRDDKTFLKPFKDIEKEALRYLNQVGE